jgi:adenylyltransferase/sulfurtransferase
VLYDALNMKFRELKLRPNPVRPVIEKLIDYEMFCGIPQAKAAEAEQQSMVDEMTVTELKQLIDSGAKDFVLIDVRNPNEYEIAKIPGSVLIPLPDIEQGKGIEQVKAVLNGHRLIAHCKMGGRSAKFSRMPESRVPMSKAGFKRGVEKSILQCRNIDRLFLA